MGILGLPNLPVDFPAQPACQSVAAVCKSILNLAHEPQVFYGPVGGIVGTSDFDAQMSGIQI